MKIRNGFVSNSSSSSFIVIDKTPIDQKNIDDIIMSRLPLISLDGNVLKFPLKYGQTYEFGWEFIKYTDWDDKLNFAFLQAIGLSLFYDKKYLELFEKYVKELFGVKLTYSLNKDGRLDYDDGYIDHQSMGNENPKNLKMFDSLEDFKQFIFNDNSFIQMGNDQEIDDDFEDDNY
jgi:hypothetical protein